MSDRPTVSVPQAGKRRAIDHAQMRSANMGLILRHLRDHGACSRAQLASGTGLSKATITSLVGSLVASQLVREGEVSRRGQVGRPGTEVMLNGERVWGVGLEINVDYLSYSVLDFASNIVREGSEPLSPEEHAPEIVVLKVARMIESIMAKSGEATIAAITITPPGIIDYEKGIVRFAPNLGWRAVPVIQMLHDELGDVPMPLYLEADAKLAGLASYAEYRSSEVRDLVHLTGDVGVGIGIISGGRLLRGWSGFSGEVGHMTLDPEGPRCRCGRKGCFELYVGLRPFLASLPVDSDARDANIPLVERLESLRGRMLAGDEDVLAALDVIKRDLVRGLGVIVDVLNPVILVLGGYFGYFAEVLVPFVDECLEARLLDEGHRVEVVPGSMGIAAASRGGAMMALERVFMEPDVLHGLTA